MNTGFQTGKEHHDTSGMVPRQADEDKGPLVNLYWAALSKRMACGLGGGRAGGGALLSLSLWLWSIFAAVCTFQIPFLLTHMHASRNLLSRLLGCTRSVSSLLYSTTVSFSL